MEPISRRDRNSILNANPAATEADIDEYERLLVNRFMTDPDVPKPPTPTTSGVAPQGVGEADERRLEELRQKLFGKP